MVKIILSKEELIVATNNKNTHENICLEIKEIIQKESNLSSLVFN